MMGRRISSPLIGGAVTVSVPLGPLARPPRPFRLLQIDENTAARGGIALTDLTQLDQRVVR